MFKIYLTTGILLLSAGILTTLYLLWFLKNKKLKYEKSFILFLSHALATAFMGIFYIYSTIIMLNNNNNQNPQQIPFYNLFHYNEYFNLTDQLSTTTQKIDFVEVQPEYLEEILYTSEIPEINITENLEYSTTTQKINSQDPAGQFLLKYQQFLKDALNKTNYEIPVLNKRKERTANENYGDNKPESDSENLYNNTRCPLQNILLQHVMLTYSFVHGLIALINSAIDCKDCMLNKEENIINGNKETPTIEDSSKTVEGIENSGLQTENLKIPINYKKLILQLLTILIPPLCASSLYFIMQNQENIPITSTDQQISKILQNPTNISTLENAKQVDNVVKNIYNIITEVKANSNLIIPQLRFVYQNNITLEAIDNCYNSPSMALKIHTFLIFVVGYFLVILYSQTAYTKLSSKADPVNAKNLKMLLYGFSTLWLPAALEIFSRIYLIRGLPNFIPELLTALGNLSHILTNIGSVLITKKVAKNQNYVQPLV